MNEPTNHMPANPATGREAEFKAALDAYVAGYRAEARRRASRDITLPGRLADWLAPLWPRRSGALRVRRIA